MMADIHSRPLIWHLRGAPTTYVRHLRRGCTAHEGVGVSFWFSARTADFQGVTVQATVTYPDQCSRDIGPAHRLRDPSRHRPVAAGAARPTWSVESWRFP